MKDARDDQTLDLLPSGKRRGRPPTGKALSPAAKQAAYRARQREKTVTVTLNRPDCGELEIFLLNLRDSGPNLDLGPEVVARLHDAVRSAWLGQLHSGNGDQK
jgi:hypothetical protein